MKNIIARNLSLNKIELLHYALVYNLLAKVTL